MLEGMTRIIAENPELSIIAEIGPSHLRMADVAPEEWLSAFQNRGFDPFVIDELSGECRLADVSKLKEVEFENILLSAAVRRHLQELCDEDRLGHSFCSALGDWARERHSDRSALRQKP